jgi:hypothetical protein
MRKSYIIILLILVAFLCALWSPWNRWNIALPQLFGIAPQEQIGGLQVTSLAGELEVFVDGNSVGIVDPATSPLVVPAIEPGERQIKLVRQTTVVGAYEDFNRLIKFESGVDVVITYELGPTADFSEGHVIYATQKLDNSSDVLLSLHANMTGATVLIDDISAGSTPIAGFKLSLDKQHKVSISKTGYDTQEFTLLPQEQINRDKLQGYNLNVDVNLFLQPLEVN